MPLIQCQDCGKEISDRSTVCIHCGGPVVKAPTRVELLKDLGKGLNTLANPPKPSTRKKYQCRHCSSEDVKLLKLVVSEGTARIDTKTGTIGVGVSKGGIGVGGASSKTTGTQTSDLAKRYAPPQTKEVPTDPSTTGCLIGALATIVLAFIISSWWVLPIGLAASFGIARAMFDPNHTTPEKEWNQKEYPRLIGKWERSFLCMRCMRVTDPDA